LNARIGHYRFSRQVGGWGAYADVRVAVQPTETPTVEVLFDVPGLHSDPRWYDWEAGARFGVHYAIERSPLVKTGIRVRITGISTNPVDSSSLTVAFATCCAVWDALGLTPANPPSFDECSKSFRFPKQPFKQR
jgi:hypothetical protein